MTRTCQVEGCESAVYATGLCHPHYDRKRLNGDPLHERAMKQPKRCSVTKCDRLVVSRGFCKKHYTRWKRHKSAEDLEPRRCEECGVQFDPPGRRSTICGKTECVKARKLRLNRESAARRERKVSTRECVGCGKQFETKSPNMKYCSNGCPARTKAMWGPLRLAMEKKDYTAVIAALKDYTATEANGCWVWQGPYGSGIYPRVGFSKSIETGKPKIYMAHRLMLEAKLGGPIEGIAAHHTCSNHGCINPDHLEPVTAAENVGEMMARHSYHARIRALEEALRAYEPTHPLLHRARKTSEPNNDS